MNINEKLSGKGWTIFGMIAIVAVAVLGMVTISWGFVVFLALPIPIGWRLYQQEHLKHVARAVTANHGGKA